MASNFFHHLLWHSSTANWYICKKPPFNGCFSSVSFRYYGKYNILSNCSRFKENFYKRRKITFSSLQFENQHVFLTAVNSKHKSPVLWKGNEDFLAQSQSVANTLRLLLFMATEFIMTSIPMAVVKIVIACGYSSTVPGFKVSFQLSMNINCNSCTTGTSNYQYSSWGFVCSLRFLPFLLV